MGCSYLGCKLDIVFWLPMPASPPLSLGCSALQPLWRWLVLVQAMQG